jgi:hypothetical protein
MMPLRQANADNKQQVGAVEGLFVFIGSSRLSYLFLCWEL